MPMIPFPTKKFRPEAMFRPRSIAVLGADQAAGQGFVARILAGGFDGPVLPVGPVPAVQGVLAYPDIASLPVSPDIAICCLPPEQLEDAFFALAARDCHAAIVPGRAPELSSLSMRSGVRALGEGSFGLCVPSIGLNASRAHLPPPAGRIALLCQSSAIANALIDWAGPNGVGFSLIAGIGTNSGFGFARTLEFLAHDTTTGAVILDVRRIRDRRHFLSAARAAARLRPVVALRAGAMLEAGDAAFGAALRRAGVLRVGSLTELLAAAETLPRVKRARSERLMILSDAVAYGRLAADAALRAGLPLAALDEAATRALSTLLPEGCDSANPLYVPAPATRLAEVAAMLAAVPAVGGIVVLRSPGAEAAEAGDQALMALAKSVRIPLIVCLPGQTTAGLPRRVLAEAGIPTFATPDEAVGAFAMLAADRRNRLAAAELPPRDVLTVAPNRAAVARIFADVRAAGHTVLEEDQALAVLESYGVPTVRTRIAATAEDAAAAAEELGFPAVLKIRSPDIPHKTDLGGVVLHLEDAAAVRRAAIQVQARVRRLRPEARLDGFVIQPMAEGAAQEVAIQVADDAMFGPTISFGHGGTVAPVVADVALDLPPLNLALARGLIGRTRVARLLAGYRDRPAADLDAVADTLVRISQLVVDFREVLSLDLNPLFCRPDGVLAADAGIVLRPPGEAALLAIPPYPAHLTRPWIDREGEPFTIRPIRPEDAEAHAAFFSRLDAETVRYRFFSILKELPPEQIARMTQLDYDREMAFIAVRGDPSETVGVARAVCEPGTTKCEFAVVVQPDMKGRGLARHLMERLVDWARQAGMTVMEGQVLAENAPMLAFVKRLGFVISRVPDDDDLVEARLSLEPAAA